MILDEIAAKTRLRVGAAKQTVPPGLMRSRAEACGGTEAAAAGPLPAERLPFEGALAAPGLSFICEVKRASPSRGLIAPDPEGFPYLAIAKEYEAAGAGAISVLTEPDYFLGSTVYLKEIAAAAGIPVLRKDFIIDEYQIYEAKVLGAQAVLLICALIDKTTLGNFLALARSLSLAVLTEVHHRAELETALDCGARIIGINNRDLTDFTVDLARSEELCPLIPPGHLVVSESGVHTKEDVTRLANCGVDALLVGESLMKAPDKRAFLRNLQGVPGLSTGRPVLPG
ncbi:MAG: indole-3-glycerol phosphate synthase TrpC [Spirochaetaceae bacterium]|jgi:indole-3-glycerol phosphate synthase|nr:indole-3-glycerol phosphate synthase TrpC [Spirochaetaceae bacterium]